MTSSPLPPLVPGLSSLAGRYDLIISDVWGVLHNGLAAHPKACDALTRARQSGVPVVLLSNAPRPGASVIQQLDGLKVPRTAYDAIVTSGDIARAEIARRGDEPFYHIGIPRDYTLFDGHMHRRVAEEEASFVVCTGLFDDDVEAPEDYLPQLERLRARGLFFLCANPDKVVEVGPRLVYCAGALADLYRDMGGEVLYAGKPFAPAYERALGEGEKVLGRRPPRERILAIGDAMRTDMAGAAGMGYDAILLAEGIHAEELMREDTVDSAALAALMVESGQTPSGVMAKLFW